MCALNVVLVPSTFPQRSHTRFLWKVARCFCRYWLFLNTFLQTGQVVASNKGRRNVEGGERRSLQYQLLMTVNLTTSNYLIKCTLHSLNSLNFEART